MTATAEKKVPMMVGTGGYADYMAFAKNGAFALGIKPVAAVDGKALGIPGSTWFAARLRSAAAGELFVSESNVIGFKKLPENHSEAWPGITWEKNAAERASTTISILIPGSAQDKTGLALLVENITDKKLATKMVDYLEKIAGKENFQLDREAAIEWFAEHYDSYANKLSTMLTTQELIQQEMDATKGTFGITADLLKKVYKAQHGEDKPEESDLEAKVVLSDTELQEKEAQEAELEDLILDEIANEDDSNDSF